MKYIHVKKDLFSATLDYNEEDTFRVKATLFQIYDVNNYYIRWKYCYFFKKLTNFPYIQQTELIRLCVLTCSTNFNLLNHYHYQDFL